MFHAAEPLVPATISPAGEADAAFYRKELANNVFLGESSNEVVLARFIAKKLSEYPRPENQIFSLDEYIFVRQLLKRNQS